MILPVSHQARLSGSEIQERISSIKKEGDTLFFIYD